MEFGTYLEQIRAQSGALLDLARETGPDVAVGTCPPWTMRDLLAHAAGNLGWCTDATRAPAGGRPPALRDQPAGWEALLDWAAQRRDELVERLTETGPDAECWTFRSGPSRSGFWARRNAHEMAMHRLDAEFARAGGTAPDAVPSLLFGSEFAADGIAEFLAVILPTARRRRDPVTTSGRVLLHAADAGRAWMVTLEPEQDVAWEETTEVDADATVAGTADAVYRRVWCRPSNAAVTGDAKLLGPLCAP